MTSRWRQASEKERPAHWISSAIGISFVAGSLRTAPTCSSTRWCQDAATVTLLRAREGRMPTRRSQPPWSSTLRSRRAQPEILAHHLDCRRRAERAGQSINGLKDGQMPRSALGAISKLIRHFDFEVSATWRWLRKAGGGRPRDEMHIGPRNVLSGKGLFSAEQPRPMPAPGEACRAARRCASLFTAVFGLWHRPPVPVGSSIDRGMRPLQRMTG